MCSQQLPDSGQEKVSCAASGLFQSFEFRVPHRCRLRSVAVPFLCCALFIVGGTQGAVITRGPYLQRASSSNIVVRWRTDTATSSRVQYGTNIANLNLTRDVTASVTDHEIVVSGLADGTRYYYTVGAIGTVLTPANTSQYFLTHPLPGSPKPMRVWVIGDAGTATANQSAVRDAFYTYNGTRDVNVWLQLGDNAYNSGTDAEYQAAVFNMYSSQLRRTVTWPTLGNHDTAQSTSYVDTYPYFSIFTFPKAGECGGVASGTEHYYSFDHGMVHFICLDSMTASRAKTGAMAVWLQNDLANTTNHWIIAYWHHPPYSKGSHNSDTEIELVEMRQNIVPILEDGGVDLVLSGHSHAYERSLLISRHYGLSTTFASSNVVQSGSGRGTGAYVKSSDPDSSAAPYGGTVYAVAGSSGQASGGTLDHPAMYISLNNLGSMVLDITSNRLDAVFLRETGATNDWFTLRKDYPLPQTSGTWIAAAGGSWTNAANWGGSAIANGTGRTADFSTLNLTANATVTLDGARTIGHLSFGDTTASHNWTLTPGNAGALTLDVTSNTPTINVSNQMTTLACILAGTDGFTKTGTGVLALTATNTLTGAIAVNGGRLQVIGRLGSNAVTVAAASLEGTGLLRGPVVVRTNGTLAPGSNAIGTLTISNTLSLAGVARMEINRTSGTSDRVSGISTLTYGGTLQVTNLSGTLATGDTFTLFSAASYTGAFTNLSLPLLPMGLAWSNRLAVNGQVAVYTANTNVPPVAMNDSASTLEDFAVAIAVLTNDSDANGNTLSIQSVTPGAHGSTTISGTNVLYAPAANWFGADAFSYTVSDGRGGAANATVTVTVTPVNDRPVAVNDSATTLEDVPVTIPVLANDIDVDGDTLAIQSVTQGTNGAVTISGTNVIYLSATNRFGVDTFTYTVTDGHGGSATAMVSVTITSVNDAPVAANDSATTLEDIPVTIPVLVNDRDVDGDTLAIQSVTQGTNGTATISGTNVIYRPATNWNGFDAFAYVVSDGRSGSATGRVSVTVLATNDAPYWTTNLLVFPVALLGNAYSNSLATKAIDPDAGTTLTFTRLTGPAWLNISTSGALTGVPMSDVLGTNTWTVQVSDGQGGSAQTTLRITVSRTATYEAELATLSGVTVATNFAGYSGTGYADYANNNNDYVQWTVPLSAAGNYSITFRYALNTGSRPLQITVNGQVTGTVAFPSSGAWTRWTNTLPLNVILNASTNTVRATVTGSNGANVDYLALTSLFTNPPVAVMFTRVAFTNGTLMLGGTGPSGGSYRMWAATNLMLPAPNWSPLATGTFNGGAFTFTDSQSTNLPARFYRLTAP